MAVYSARGMPRSASAQNIALPSGITASLKSKRELCSTQPDSAPPCPRRKYAPGRACSMNEKSSEPIDGTRRSEEHTSELQSLMRISYAVFCLKKKKKKHKPQPPQTHERHT